MLDGDTPTMEEFLAMMEQWPSDYKDDEKNKDSEAQR